MPLFDKTSLTVGQLDVPCQVLIAIYSRWQATLRSSELGSILKQYNFEDLYVAIYLKIQSQPNAKKDNFERDKPGF